MVVHVKLPTPLDVLHMLHLQDNHGLRDARARSTKDASVECDEYHMVSEAGKAALYRNAGNIRSGLRRNDVSTVFRRKQSARVLR